MSPAEITFIFLSCILCALNAGDIITTHLIFKTTPSPRERNPLLAKIVKKGSSFVSPLTVIKLASVGLLIGASWFGMKHLAWGDCVALIGLAFVNGWYAAIVAGNLDEYLSL